MEFPRLVDSVKPKPKLVVPNKISHEKMISGSALVEGRQCEEVRWLYLQSTVSISTFVPNVPLAGLALSLNLDG